jgi:hypothetical protein
LEGRLPVSPSIFPCHVNFCEYLCKNFFCLRKE